jgi:hypothetical protein
MADFIALCPKDISHNDFLFPVHVAASAAGDRHGVSSGKDKDLFVDEWESTPIQYSEWYCRECGGRAISAKVVAPNLYHAGTIINLAIEGEEARAMIRTIIGEKRRMSIAMRNILSLDKENLGGLHLFFFDHPKNPKYVVASDSKTATNIINS